MFVFYYSDRILCNANEIPFKIPFHERYTWFTEARNYNAKAYALRARFGRARIRVPAGSANANASGLDATPSETNADMVIC